MRLYCRPETSFGCVVGNTPYTCCFMFHMNHKYFFLKLTKQKPLKTTTSSEKVITGMCEKIKKSAHKFTGFLIF